MVEYKAIYSIAQEKQVKYGLYLGLTAQNDRGVA